MEEEEKDSNHHHEDPFTRMMFGSRGQMEDQQQQPSGKTPGTSIDLDELMTNLDTLIESAKNLKPVFQKALPTLEKIWNKWKEDD